MLKKEDTKKEKDSFWQKIKRPILCLAPMSDVTDPAFRLIIAKYGKPRVEKRGLGFVMWTEFVSADGLLSSAGRRALLKNLAFDEAERPIVAQIFSARPEAVEQAAALARKLGFDGVDINMGCPHKSVVDQGAGAALIKNPKRARELIRAAKRGAESASRRIPVSIKTRIGFNKDELDAWLPELLAEKPAAIIIHARTKKELSLVPAEWAAIARAVKLRDKLKSKTLIIGNGDVADMEDALEKIKQSGADGAMIGRAFLGNPWLSDQQQLVSSQERLEVLLEHARLFQKKLGYYKSFDMMKKHFKAYVNGWRDAKRLRIKLMEAENAQNVAQNIAIYLRTHKNT